MKTVSATVDAIVPEFEFVRLVTFEAGEEIQLSIGNSTAGVDWRALRVGQALVCELEGWEHSIRVVRARLADG